MPPLYLSVLLHTTKCPLYLVVVKSPVKVLDMPYQDPVTFMTSGGP